MQEPIYPYEEAAEHRENIHGWVCLTCRKYHGANEHAARFCCAASMPCKGCGGRTDRNYYTHCRTCRDQKETEKYDSAPQQAWDGLVPLCTWQGDTYFFNVEDLQDYIDNLDGDGLPRLEICQPARRREFELLDWAYEDTDEDCELDEAGEAAQKAVNEWLAKQPTLWEGSGVRPTERSVREAIG